LLLAAGVRADALSAQSWRVDLQAGQASYETAQLPSRTVSSILGLRYARDQRFLQASVATPLGSGDLYWGAVRAGDRLAFRRGRSEAALDVSVLAHAQRDGESGVGGSGAQLRILPLLSTSMGSLVAEWSGGPSLYRGRFGGTEWSRDLLVSDLRLRMPLRSAGTIAGEVLHVRADEASYTHLGISASAALGPGYAWGALGVWVSGLPQGLPSSGWGAGASLPLRHSTDLWGAIRREPFDPLFLGTARTSWSIGLSHRLGSPGSRTPQAGPELRASGATILRLPLTETSRPPSVAGDFSEWEPIRMHRRGDSWHLELQLEPGVYYYAFRSADNSWFVPESFPNRRDDGMGGWVAVLVVPSMAER